MSDKLPINDAISKMDLRFLRKAILMEHLTKEMTTEYGEHVAATFNLQHDLYCGLRATMEIHDLHENASMVIRWALAQLVVHTVILCGDWPDEFLGLEDCDPEFKNEYIKALIELQKRVMGEFE